MNIELEHDEIALLVVCLRYAKRNISEGDQQYAGKREKLGTIEKLEAKLRNSVTPSAGQP
jgi:hypothetical protein